MLAITLEEAVQKVLEYTGDDQLDVVILPPEQ